MKKFNPKLTSVQKIWSHADHNALTDLIFFKNAWYCIFREASHHVYGNNGVIRLIKSHDGQNWESICERELEGIDLRDPKLSITPDGRLMMLVGGTIYEGKKYIVRQSRVSFSNDGENWSEFELVIEPHEWLWRITWHKGKAYGASYRTFGKEEKLNDWQVRLWESEDGLNYTLITHWPIRSFPNETTLQFLDNDQMIAFVRRDGTRDRKAWIGSSSAPYTHWEWHITHGYFGGPNFIVLPDKSLWAAGRVIIGSAWGLYEQTVLASMSNTDYKPEIILPSWGDSSYPGLAYKDDELWMSYYSSHEKDKTCIYLAKFVND